MEPQDMADKRWVQQPHSEHSQLSVHESQLSESKFKIERLHIQHPDGTAYDFKPKPGLEGATLKLIFIGGTDDPSVALQFTAVSRSLLEESKEKQNLYKFAVILKFGAFLSDQVTVSYNRKVVKFCPNGPGDFNDLEKPFPGSTNFSNALYNLLWHRYDEGERQMVRLSWKLKSAVSYGLSLLVRFDRVDSSHRLLATTFSYLASNLNAGLPSQTITVDTAWTPALEYRYRYLLASDINLEAYRRYRLTGSKTARRVPFDLCVQYPLDGSKIQSLEMPPPKSRAEKNSYRLGAGDKSRGFTQNSSQYCPFVQGQKPNSL
jgi:hypothetical protein